MREAVLDRAVALGEYILDTGATVRTHGLQYDTVTFLHANAGRITKAVITGADAKNFSVTPELIPGTVITQQPSAEACLPI